MSEPKKVISPRVRSPRETPVKERSSKCSVLADDFSNFVWLHHATPKQPSYRSHSSVFEYHAQVFMFGGLAPVSHICLSDLHIFSFDTKQWSEVKPGPSATWPCARHGHTVSTHEGSGYLYGGEDEQGKILGDFYLFSCHSHRWCKITTAGKPPPPLVGHSSVVFRNALYLFGGFDGNRFNNNIYKYDFDTSLWGIVLSKSRNVPHPRRFQSACVHSSCMYIFGGCDKESFGDLWSFNFVSRKWTMAPSVKPRRGHVGVAFGNYMIIAGGRRGQKDITTVQTYNFYDKSWKTRGDLPQFRSYAAGIVINGAVVLFGGLNESNKKAVQVSTKATELSGDLGFFGAPPEIIERIMMYLSPPDLGAMNVASRAMYLISGSEKVWKRLFVKFVEANENTTRFPFAPFGPVDIVRQAELAVEELDTIHERKSTNLPWQFWKNRLYVPWKWSHAPSYLPDQPSNAALSSLFSAHAGLNNAMDVVVMGAGGVGKTAQLNQWVSRTFQDEWDPTIQNTIRGNVAINGKRMQLDVLDTAGSEDFFLVVDAVIKTTNCFILMYSVTDSSTFLELDTFLNRIKEIRAGIKSPYCVILVANKRDMYLTRTVDSQSGIKWARERHIPYLEASARTRFNTDEIFKLAVYQTAYTLYDLPRQREPQRAKPVLGEVVQVVKSEKRKEVQIQREQGREVIVETTTSTRKVVRRSVGEDDKQLTLRERTEADPKPKSRSHRKAK